MSAVPITLLSSTKIFSQMQMPVKTNLTLNAQALDHCLQLTHS